MAAAAFIGVHVAPGHAEVVNVERSGVFVVGGPPSGDAKSGLGVMEHPMMPIGELRARWTVSVGTDVLEHAPVIDHQGSICAVDSVGNVTAISKDGTVLWQVATGARDAAAPAVLADDTILIMSSSGDAVALRAGVVLWRAPATSRSRAPTAALALYDGGVAISVGPVITLLDADGGIRARTSIASSSVVSLLGFRDVILAADTSGVVWSWTAGPGGPERVGSLGDRSDAPALIDRWLVSIASSGTRVVELDILSHRSTVVAEARAGERFLGGPTLRESVRDGHWSAIIQASSPNGEFAIVLSDNGQEQSRRMIFSRAPVVLPDGGTQVPSSEPRTPLIVDASGTLVFSTASGDVGSVRGDTVQRLSGVCSPQRAQVRGASEGSGSVRPSIVGLSWLPPRTILATCRSGIISSLEEVPSGGQADQSNL
jgi:hypothetical protein